MYFDNHIHTNYSYDGNDSLEDIIKEAKRKGLSGITVTDHFDYDESLTMVIDYDTYLPAIKNIIDKEQDENFKVYTGMELGLDRRFFHIYPDYLEKYSFDFIIGSMHFVDGFDPYYDEYFEGHDVDERIQRFFQCTLETLTAYSNIDTLGHLDYVIRYATRYSWDNGLADPEVKLNKTLEEILMYLIDKDLCMEVNTGALHYGFNEPNPCYKVIEKYYELGGRRITLGSDTHKLSHIAIGFDTVPERLKEIGFKSFFIFEKRKAIELPL